MKVYLEIEIKDLSKTRLLTLNRQGYITDNNVTSELVRRGEKEWKVVELLRANSLMRENNLLT